MVKMELAPATRTPAPVTSVMLVLSTFTWALVPKTAIAGFPVEAMTVAVEVMLEVSPDATRAEPVVLRMVESAMTALALGPDATTALPAVSVTLTLLTLIDDCVPVEAKALPVVFEITVESTLVEAPAPVTLTAAPVVDSIEELVIATLP